MGSPVQPKSNLTGSFKYLVKTNFSVENPINISNECKDLLEHCYENGDLRTRFRRRYNKYKYRNSLAPIDEIIYHDLGIVVTKSDQSYHLCKGVFMNEIGWVSKLLGLGISPNCFDDHKRTPLHLAVSKGYCEMVQLLLDNGADPNIIDGVGNSCLHLAACTNNVDIAMILIKGGASVNSVDIRGRSPIQLAQSKLKLLQASSNIIKSKIQKIIDMLLLYLEKGYENKEKPEEAELLSNFQNRLQISDDPEKISDEIDNLSKLLDDMETLTIK